MLIEFFRKVRSPVEVSIREHFVHKNGRCPLGSVSSAIVIFVLRFCPTTTWPILLLQREIPWWLWHSRFWLPWSRVSKHMWGVTDHGQTETSLCGSIGPVSDGCWGVLQGRSTSYRFKRYPEASPSRYGVSNHYKQKSRDTRGLWWQ